MTHHNLMACLLAAALALPAGPVHADANRDAAQLHRHDSAGRIIIGDIGSGSVRFFDRQTQRLLRLHDVTGRAFRFDGRYTSAGALVLNVALLVPGSCFTAHQTRPIVDLHEPQGWGAALWFSDPIEDLDHRQELIDWFLIYLTPSLARRYQREIGDQPPGARWITLYRDDLADHGYPICGTGGTVRYGLTGGRAMSDDTLKEATETGIEMAKLLAAASHASAAAFDLIEVVRDGGVLAQDNVGAGDTATILADGLRLLIEVTGDMDDADGSVSQLHGALIRFLEDRA